MAITRQAVVETALDLLDKVGFEGLTMRGLASALDIKAASLYWHFSSKKDLVDGMADALVAHVAKSRINLPWNKTLQMVSSELRCSLLARRDGARVFAGTYVVSENVVRVGDALIASLVGAGATTKLATWAAFSLLYYVLGFVVEEQALAQHGAEEMKIRGVALLALTKDRFPTTLNAIPNLLESDLDQRFSWGVDVFIAGLAGTLGLPL